MVDEFQFRTSVSTSGAFSGCVVYTASAKPKRFEMTEKFASDKELFSFVPPSAGMFLWLKIHFENVPGFRPGQEEPMEVKLFTTLAEAGVLMGPGRYFAADEAGVSPLDGHLRASFSFSSVRVV